MDTEFAKSEEVAIDLDQLVAALDTPGQFPEETIRTCQRHREIVTPRLIDVMRRTASLCRQGKLPDGNAHLFALYLAWEFEAAEAWPAICELISLTGDPVFELLGDTITEDLNRILATFCAATPELLEAMIDDPQVDFYVRWAAAQSFAFLVRDGRVSREDAVERLRTRLDNALDRADGELASALVSTLLYFYPREAMSSIERAFRMGLVDPMMIRQSTVEEEMNEPDAESCPRLKRLQATRICDTVEELRPWFSRREDRNVEDDPDPEPEFGNASLLDDYEAPRSYREDTIRYEALKVGRNDPCPCGSGKKFKKCCLRSGANAK